MDTVNNLRCGDIAVFKSHKLRVEKEPVRKGRRIKLQGRENRNGCPYVTRWYFDNVPLVRIEGGE